MIHSTDKAICVKRQLLHVMGGGVWGGTACLCVFVSQNELLSIVLQGYT